MFKQLCSALAICICTFQCLAQTPLEYNNKLVGATDSLFILGSAWGTKYTELRKGSQKYSELKPLRQHMQQYIDRRVKSLKTMKDISGSRNLREAVINFMDYEKLLIENAFIPLEKLSSASGAVAHKNATDRLSKESEQEAVYLGKITAAQQEYAKRNNFKVESADK